MKHLLFAFIIITAFSFTINKSVASNKILKLQDTSILAGKWQLVPVLSSDTSAGKTPYLSFDLKTGKFTGNTGCNAISGEFMVQQNALKFAEHLISTKMSCPGFNERTFLENLLKANRYEINNGVLQLMYNTTILSRWTRHVDTNPIKEM